MNTTQISPGHPPDILQTPPRHLQGTRDANRWQQTPTETKSQPETPQDTDGCCLSMSGSVSWRLLVSFYSWRWQGGVWGTCGGVWGVSEGIWVLFLEIGSAQMCFGFSAFAVRSHNIILAQPGKAWLFFTWPKWDLKISKCLYMRLTKMIELYDFVVF